MLPCRMRRSRFVPICRPFFLKALTATDSPQVGHFLLMKIPLQPRHRTALHASLSNETVAVRSDLQAFLPESTHGNRLTTGWTFPAHEDSFAAKASHGAPCFLVE